MTTLNYQTITLSRGSHASPGHGACVMELSSMLAGEAFTDRPASVSPVIGSLLRAYNDRVDDGRRQDLYHYASESVGSRGAAGVERARADRLAAWARQMRSRRAPVSLLPRRVRELLPQRELPVEILGSYAVRSVRKTDDGTHAAMLALVDEMLLIGSEGLLEVDEERVLEPAQSPQPR